MKIRLLAPDSAAGQAAPENTEPAPAAVTTESSAEKTFVPATSKAAPETPEQTIARLTKENAKLREASAAAAAAEAQRLADEEVIEAKVKAGLTRAQAIAVIKRQRVHDEFVASERKNRLPALLKIIGTHKRDLRAARRLAREDYPFLDGGEWAAAVAEFKNSNQKP